MPTKLVQLRRSRWWARFALPGAALAGEPLFYIVFLQVPMYLAAMTAAAFRLNRMLVTTMRAERENSHRAHHDALTGLLNRAGFVEALGGRLAARAERPFAVMFFDLDNFKPINDTFGHAAGDAVLKAVAARVRRLLPDDALVARMGGDEFVVLLDGVTAEMAQQTGHRLISEVALSYELSGEMHACIGASVGIALSPDHGADVAGLLAVADAALYQAKSGGKSRCCLASVESNLAALRQLQQSPKAPLPSAA
ncbi:MULTISPECIES: GGDEF domain-containing protein [Bradyrhizobium]|uniref:GGDEF domain-containing protein n=1 Tax=Bradyrhizobium TaxID=374 RepID=UPI002305717D|nr:MULTISPECIES: GGDEF domain-containing protein [unclassified Bradyrhizobium]